MLRRGKEYLAGLQDGRTVMVGAERVRDVASHPAFRNTARMFAALFEAKADPAKTELLSFEEGGERYSMYYLRPRSREDLLLRMAAHKWMADFSHGLLGRSPDHVASFVTGMALNDAPFVRKGQIYGQRLQAYYEHLRRHDLYACYAVAPPTTARFDASGNGKMQALRVVAEDDAGVTVEGMKMLATGAVFSDEIWVGNIQPLPPGSETQAITFAIPVGTPGITLWSRKPYELGATNEFDNPLSYAFDESDCMVIFDKVHVPWERVFTIGDADQSREIYFQSPGHALGNHQSNVRFWAKLQFLVGMASIVTRYAGVSDVPAVRESLGRLAAYEATIAGMIHGQCGAFEQVGKGFVTFDRRIVYAALNWCYENYGPIVTIVREMCGAVPFQLPADISVIHNPDAGRVFEEYWSGGGRTAVERMKLYRLVWDMVGSELASRHMQYESAYAGPPFVVRAHNFREAPWAEMERKVEEFMATYDAPGRPAQAAE